MCPVAGAQSSMYKQDMYAMYSYDFPKMVFTHKVNNNLHILDAEMHLTEGLTDIKHEQNKLKTEPPSIVLHSLVCSHMSDVVFNNYIVYIVYMYVFRIRPH